MLKNILFVAHKMTNKIYRLLGSINKMHFQRDRCNKKTVYHFEMSFFIFLV